MNRYTNAMNESFQETFVSNYCSNFGTESTLIIEPKSLTYGYYLSVYTVSRKSNMADYQQLTQPIEIIRSDLITEFGGNETMTNNNGNLHLDFYLTTIDPDKHEVDRHKLNFTLLCYPESMQASIFLPNTVQLGSSRPTDTNPQNINDWSIQWVNFDLVFHRPELNIQFYEKLCFSSTIKQDNNQELIQYDSDRKTLDINENNLIFQDGTLHFLLIVRHTIDDRQLIALLKVDKQKEPSIETANLNELENIMRNLDYLAASNPTQAVEFINNLADRLNQMSDNSVSLLYTLFLLSAFTFSIERD